MDESHVLASENNCSIGFPTPLQIVFLSPVFRLLAIDTMRLIFLLFSSTGLEQFRVVKIISMI